MIGCVVIFFTLSIVDDLAHANDESVQQAQVRLKELGYDPGSMDGIWGPRTKSAVEKFQADKGLKITGGLDEPTRNALGIQNKPVTSALPKYSAIYKACSWGPPPEKPGFIESIDAQGRAKLSGPYEIRSAGSITSPVTVGGPFFCGAKFIVKQKATLHGESFNPGDKVAIDKRGMPVKVSSWD
jgi:peptidoglycan hydrolase-like protein with peptidoglycan-binding domain